ncbi:MAG: DUF192 domain-containing protein [Alphaproteobacteria bacterium]|nr:DUF192 domain-containing protein [Alphaproteobacteria bacterium]MBV9061888.1 DUF192 domain-containing protein [Alphaproteobacteria bacterium]
MRHFLFALAATLAWPAAASNPQPLSLPHSQIVIDTPKGPVRLEVEVAADSASRMRGLMYRTHLAANSGMLFDFHRDDFCNFWMKNTVLPLDMIFIRADGTISSIAANTTPYSEKTISSTEPVRAVLEINGGRAAALGIRPGEKVHNPAFAASAPAR